MAFNAVAPLAQLQAMLLAAGAQSAVVGVPESLPNKVSSYVALIPQEVADKTAGGFLQRTIVYFCGLGYRVAGAEATAETTLAGVLDAFMRLFFADRTLGGTVDSARMDLSLGNTPDYRLIAGQEFRLMPLLIVAKQSETIPPP